MNLPKLLAYRHQDTIDRFVEEFDVSDTDASAIFTEMLKWIWLCAQAHEDRRAGIDVPRLVMDRHLQSLDEMWHYFILFTEDYANFCVAHFGRFVHHYPTPTRTKATLKNQLASTSHEFESTIEARRAQYHYTCDKLGPETLELWYGILAIKHWNLPRRDGTEAA